VYLHGVEVVEPVCRLLLSYFYWSLHFESSESNHTAKNIKKNRSQETKETADDRNGRKTGVDISSYP
jgi:hypothetical protein